MNKTDVYMKALSTYGIKNQLVMCMEECAELAKECSKLYRKFQNGYPKTIDIMHLSEEIADVEIMIEQLKLFYDLDDEVEADKRAKIHRLADRLYDGDSKQD